MTACRMTDSGGMAIADGAALFMQVSSIGS